MKLTVREVTIAGILSAVSVVLGLTPLGFIPVPTPAGSATIMHLPVIIGGIMSGPVVGGLVGLIFGLFSFIRGVSFFVDPVIAIIPRILIGILAAYSYKLVNHQLIGSGVAAVVGTLTNTGGVLILATLRGYLTIEAALGVAVGHGIPEVIVGVVITLIIVKVLQTTEVSN
ncbi:ECF transporter S component [Natroniella sulfidigena]|uniref:ECF transporter S component n=1 Tax=Natroniella sulfidigena TaxID=723921 RepID=UPI00200B0133|nr:ECF transporter S component [Natroniella sulfidigena]MCK8816991.1 ECF transporter S component [Natroniella sulfidigena]